MAISKTINNTSKSLRGMKRAIRYILREDKLQNGYAYMTGPAPTEITPDSVYEAFVKEKQAWDKLGGRLYNHNVISFPPNENITAEQALAFGKEFALQWFPSNQTVIAIHEDTTHLHMHLITNTVNFDNGSKLHNSKQDLLEMKSYTNDLCRKYGLSVTEKGKDMHGACIRDGEVRSWNKDKYHLLVSDKQSYIADCAIAVVEAKEQSHDRESFIKNMTIRGWDTIWDERKKHITFRNTQSQKVRDSNLSKHSTWIFQRRLC